MNHAVFFFTHKAIFKCWQKSLTNQKIPALPVVKSGTPPALRCHINPAVTVALAATGKFPWREVPGYVIAQVIGATAGALAIVGTLGRTAADLETLVPLQSALLESALSSVRPGGVVAYVTCSPHPAETRGVVDRLLGGRPDVREEDARALLPDVPATGPGPHVQLWPHQHGTDAMFLSVLRLLP